MGNRLCGAGLLVSGLLTGCVLDPTKHTMVILQHPETKETKECRGNALATWNVYAEVEECAKAYEKAGFVRLGQY